MWLINSDISGLCRLCFFNVVSWGAPVLTLQRDNLKAPNGTDFINP